MEHYVVRRISDQWGLVSGYIGPFATGQGSRGQLWVQAVRKRFSSPKRLHGTGATHVDAAI